MTWRRQRRALAARWERLRRSPKWRPVALVWIALAAIFCLREAFGYAGVAALVAEWQFRTVGRYLPALSLLLLVLILGLPAFLVLALLRRRDRRQRRQLMRDGNATAVVAAVAAGATGLLRALVAGAGAALLVTLAALVLAIRLPTDEGPRQQLDARVPAQPREGPALLNGNVLYNRTATLQQDMLFIGRTMQFAPVVDARDPSLVRYVAEITPERLLALDGGRNNPPFTGILRRNALPGAVLRLFRYAGFRVDPPHYVLFASRTTMAWPFYIVAMGAGTIFLVLLFLALVQRRWLRRNEERRRAAPPPPADTPPADNPPAAPPPALTAG